MDKDVARFTQPGPLTNLSLHDIGLTAEDSTKNTMNFIDMVACQGLEGKDGAPTDCYTPSYGVAQHVFDLSIYNPTNRVFELL
jgi:hypothetical protein